VKCFVSTKEDLTNISLVLYNNGNQAFETIQLKILDKIRKNLFEKQFIFFPIFPFIYSPKSTL